MNKELISVIVPIYNVEKYLRDCIDSIVGQTYKQIEIILVDDGSPDDCGKLCDDYAKNDERIIVVHKENGGLSDARNAGLDIAKGSYVVFLDSDDYVNEFYVEKLYNAIISEKVEIAQCGIIQINDNNQVLEKNGYKQNLLKQPREMMIDLYNGKLENIVTWNKIYSKKLFDKIRFPKGKIHEDEFCIYKILYETDKIAIINENLYYYRRNDNSITGKKFNIKRLNRLEALEERLEFYKEKEDDELYCMTLKSYLYNIKDFYVKVKKNIDNSKKIQKDLVKKYRRGYRNILIQKDVKLGIKFKWSIFYIIPNLFYILKKGA